MSIKDDLLEYVSREEQEKFDRYDLQTNVSATYYYNLGLINKDTTMYQFYGLDSIFMNHFSPERLCADFAVEVGILDNNLDVTKEWQGVVAYAKETKKAEYSKPTHFVCGFPQGMEEISPALYTKTYWHNDINNLCFLNQKYFGFGNLEFKDYFTKRFRFVTPFIVKYLYSTGKIKRFELNYNKEAYGTFVDWSSKKWVCVDGNWSTTDVKPEFTSADLIGGKWLGEDESDPSFCDCSSLGSPYFECVENGFFDIKSKIKRDAVKHYERSSCRSYDIKIGDLEKIVDYWMSPAFSSFGC